MRPFNEPSHPQAPELHHPLWQTFAELSQMAEAYLVAHVVRGKPAFDVAERMECPLCAGHGHDLDGYCHECDSKGYWWIIPTSGHRAYPYWYTELSELYGADQCPSEPPPNWPDHYKHGPSPKIDIKALFAPAKPKQYIQRRL